MAMSILRLLNLASLSSSPSFTLTIPLLPHPIIAEFIQPFLYLLYCRYSEHAHRDYSVESFLFACEKLFIITTPHQLSQTKAQLHENYVIMQ